MLIRHYQEDKEIEYEHCELFASMGACVIANLLNKMLTPYGLYLVIERFLKDSLPSFIFELEDKKPALNSFKTEIELDKKIGEEFTLIVKILIQMGRPKGMTKLAAKGYSHLLKNQKEKLGVICQQWMSQIKSSPSRLFLLSVIHHLLFYQKEGQLQPSLINFLDKTESRQLKDNLCEILLNKLKEIKQHSLLSNLLTPSEDFCHRIIEELWSIIEEEKHVKLLGLYILKGLNEGLTKNS